MDRRQWVRALLTLAIAVLVVPGVAAQSTTGRILGTVADLEGRPLAGVAVTIISPVLIGGPQTRVTSDDGRFQFVGLHPGAYTVTASLPGFVSQERQQVKVPLGGAAALSIEMPVSTFESEIEVVAETPVVDPIQTNTDQVFDLKYLRNAAVGSFNRAYQA
ncbi:MAG TPA: carboxypeptidase-like regulatory domain-containing protein, partial [Chondromyces sp.]|nr:carboxypeptidase-like regulatory domain-containing protein [Chondromyces sp.]